MHTVPDPVPCESEPVWAELATSTATPALSGVVRAYTGYEERARQTRTLREIPSGDVALIISFGSSLSITDPRDGSAVERRSFVAGVHDGYVEVQVPPRQRGVEVRLTPLGAYTLLGLPLHSLANRAVALEDVLGRVADRLTEQLDGLPDWQARFDHLDQVLTRLAQQGRAPSATAAWAWRRLEETSGRLPIAALAAELGCSRKHIAERFRDEVGVPAKTLARVLRFKRAVRLLREGQITLAEIAHRCGYFDQAHFNRDFRNLAGATPTDFALQFSTAAA